MVWGKLGYVNIISNYCIIMIDLETYGVLVKHAYNEALHLHEQGFKGWVSNVWEIANKYQINIETKTSSIRQTIKNQINEHFINYWKTSVADVAMNPSCVPIISSYPILNSKLISKLLKMVVTDTYSQNSEQAPTIQKLSVVDIPIPKSTNAFVHIVKE